MKYRKKYSQETAALKVGIDIKTARKYERSGRLPSELTKGRTWRTRPDPFLAVWPKLEEKVRMSSQLSASTLLRWLMEEAPDTFSMRQLRTLQYRLKAWRAEHGADQAVIFPQTLLPGRQSQSDFTCMNRLEIIIGNEPFHHLLHHFMLPYSGWEWVSICQSETFEALSSGYEQAVWVLGGVAPEHRTDNLSAAVKRIGQRKVFTQRWEELLDHYAVKASRNNPGIAHENGSVEKSHDLLKHDLEQQLLLRGSRHFANQTDYEQFLRAVVEQRNKRRCEKVSIEVSALQRLPNKKYHAPLIVMTRVSTASTVRLLKGIYSVPSRLIRYSLKAHIYAQEIELYYGTKCVQKMPRLPKGQVHAINYRHIIHHLVRKPGAFAQYQYRECLFPRLAFRQAYDCLIKQSPQNGHKAYLALLQLAAQTSESEVNQLLQQALDAKQIPNVKTMKAALQPRTPLLPPLNIVTPCLGEYDQLLKGARL